MDLKYMQAVLLARLYIYKRTGNASKAHGV